MPLWTNFCGTHRTKIFSRIWSRKSNWTTFRPYRSCRPTPRRTLKIWQNLKFPISISHTTQGALFLANWLVNPTADGPFSFYRLLEEQITSIDLSSFTRKLRQVRERLDRTEGRFVGPALDNEALFLDQVSLIKKQQPWQTLTMNTRLLRWNKWWWRWSSRFANSTAVSCRSKRRQSSTRCPWEKPWGPCSNRCVTLRRSFKQWQRHCLFKASKASEFLRSEGPLLIDTLTDKYVNETVGLIDGYVERVINLTENYVGRWVARFVLGPLSLPFNTNRGCFTGASLWVEVTTPRPWPCATRSSTPSTGSGLASGGAIFSFCPALRSPSAWCPFTESPRPIPVPSSNLRRAKDSLSAGPATKRKGDTDATPASTCQIRPTTERDILIKWDQLHFFHSNLREMASSCNSLIFQDRENRFQDMAPRSYTHQTSREHVQVEGLFRPPSPFQLCVIDVVGLVSEELPSGRPPSKRRTSALHVESQPRRVREAAALLLSFGPRSSRRSPALARPKRQTLGPNEDAVTVTLWKH